MKHKSVTAHTVELNIIFVLIVVLIVYAISSSISFYSFSDTLKSSIRRTIIYRAAENADFIKQEVVSFKRIIEGITLNSDIMSMNWEYQKPVLLNECERLGIKSFQISNLDGIAHSTHNGIEDISDTDYYKQAKTGITVLTDPFIRDPGTREIMLCSSPIYDKNEKIIGVLVATLHPDFLTRIVETRRAGMTGYSFILNKEGEIIANQVDELMLQQQKSTSQTINKTNSPTSFSSLIHRMSHGEIGYGFYRLNGTEKFMAFAPISNTDWSLAITVPKSELYYELNALQRRFIISIIISFVLIILFSIILYWYTTERRKSQILRESVMKKEQLLRESMELDNLKTEFFANISHELRTPINVILGTIQLLNTLITSSSQLDENSLGKYLKIIKQNSLRLIRLVNNLIDTTKIDAGFFQINMNNYNIVSIVEEITLSVADFIKNNDIQLQFDTDTEEKIIACDADKIERIILNLLSNAIKFTDKKGYIYVTIYDKSDYISISVRDTGIGIPDDKIDLIFSRFRQVDKSLKRNCEGSGIGLSLVKSLVEMHNGKVSVTSTLGKGTEFMVELPAKTIPYTDNSYINNDVPDTNYYVERIRVEFSDIYL